MIRDMLGDKTYWDNRFNVQNDIIAQAREQTLLPSGNPEYRPQYVYGISSYYKELIPIRYSRGDAITELAQYFPPLMDMWEESERLGQAVWSPEIQHSRHTWAVNKDFYMDCFWLVGLALALQIPHDQWQRLLTLMGNEGEDALLDRIIASRQPQRRIGHTLCHPKPYRRLLEAINAPAPQQPQKLRVFVDKWYPELNGGKSIYKKPYWYNLHTNLEGGAYFGFWCIEAVAAVKALGLDDSLCLGHPHYPGDLLRANGPSTHPLRPEAESAPAPHKRGGWWSKLLRT